MLKKKYFFFLIIYSIILISFLLTDYKDISFLASFFYFRYFFLSLAIFYLLKKYDFYLKIFFYSIIISISTIVFDAYFQQIFSFNLFGYNTVGLSQKDGLVYLTSFFNQEKKLGSYLVRFLPLILSLIYFYQPKRSVSFEIISLIILGSLIFFSSERTALFLLFIIYIFYFLASNKKIFFLISISITFLILINYNANSRLTEKYFNFTLHQTGLITLFKKNKESNYKAFEKNRFVRYYSEEHENLSYTGLIIFKNNYFFGSGVKTFYHECEKIKKTNFHKKNKRNNELLCSTHPHNTYIQILSEIGIFGFLVILFLFLYVLFNNLKIILKKNKNNFDLSHLFINLSLIINLMPLIPSGSFFNNWMSLMIFFPLGFWMYIKKIR